MSDPTVEITLTICTDHPADALRIAETLSRTAAGYALDGAPTQLDITRINPTPHDEDTNYDADITDPP